MNSPRNFNRLKNSQSLYLKQHQNNPVFWWPYGPEALAFAKEQHKPIFLSIGYSSCHWCHVMGHESFADPKVAEFLNENFVAIKVDREEFPDIDNYYQKAAQLFGNNGGWPLSAFLLPDTKPFFIGTYYPLISKPNSPSFLELIQELKHAFYNDKEQVEKNAQQVTEAMKKKSFPSNSHAKFEGHFPHPNGILEAVKEYRDLTYGGYGISPKFPNFSYYEWALEQMLEGMVSKEQGDFIIKTCEHILMGGIHDHARGGIHRYSTDAKWCVPHFEKMLCDQAGLLKMATKLSLVSPTPLVFDCLINTIDYLENEMLSETNEMGARHFFSAQDADSEGVEGLYFTFLESEFEDMINQNDNEDEILNKNIDQIKNWFQISSQGNFEHNLNIISLNPALKEEFFQQKNWDLIRKIRRGILNQRKERMPPATDNKGVASWNFQIISALVDVVQYSQVDVIKKMASNLINSTIEGVFKTFLQNTEQGMKMRHTTTISSSLPYLEDFVFFAESQLRLYEISANIVFKKNFEDSLHFITKEFLENDKMLTRAKLSTHLEAYPNQEYNFFDLSFKSPVATYLQLMRRAAALFSNHKFLDEIMNLQGALRNVILSTNPVNAGESLRALTYPPEAYRVLKLPKAWAQKEEFLKFIPFFLPRFVISYHLDETNEIFEICSMNSCEVKGEGFDQFIKTLTPAEGN